MRRGGRVRRGGRGRRGESEEGEREETRYGENGHMN